jgi:hypothetical protein
MLLSCSLGLHFIFFMLLICFIDDFIDDFMIYGCLYGIDVTVHDTVHVTPIHAVIRVGNHRTHAKNGIFFSGIHIVI